MICKESDLGEGEGRVSVHGGLLGWTPYVLFLLTHASSSTALGHIVSVTMIKGSILTTYILSLELFCNYGRNMKVVNIVTLKIKVESSRSGGVSMTCSTCNLRDDSNTCPAVRYIAHTHMFSSHSYIPYYTTTLYRRIVCRSIHWTCVYGVHVQ